MYVPSELPINTVRGEPRNGSAGLSFLSGVCPVLIRRAAPCEQTRNESNVRPMSEPHPLCELRKMCVRRKLNERRKESKRCSVSELCKAGERSSRRKPGFAGFIRAEGLIRCRRLTLRFEAASGLLISLSDAAFKTPRASGYPCIRVIYKNRHSRYTVSL